jgi:hypothetical protein
MHFRPHAKAKKDLLILCIQTNILQKLNHFKNVPNTHIDDHSLSWLGTGTSMKSGWIKLLLYGFILYEYCCGYSVFIIFLQF